MDPMRSGGKPKGVFELRLCCVQLGWAKGPVDPRGRHVEGGHVGAKDASCGCGVPRLWVLERKRSGKGDAGHGGCGVPWSPVVNQGGKPFRGTLRSECVDMAWCHVQGRPTSNTRD